MAEAPLVLPCPAEPGVRAPTGPGSLLWLLQERVLPLHFPQRHHLPVLGRQPASHPPAEACRGAARAQGSAGSWAVQSRALSVPSGRPATSPPRPPLCSLAWGVLGRRLCPPPLQPHAPGRRARPLTHQLPPAQRDRVRQGQCQPHPPRQGLKPGVSAVLLAGGGGPACRDEGGGVL